MSTRTAPRAVPAASTTTGPTWSRPTDAMEGPPSRRGWASQSSPSVTPNTCAPLSVRDRPGAAVSTASGVRPSWVSRPIRKALVDAPLSTPSVLPHGLAPRAPGPAVMPRCRGDDAPRVVWPRSPTRIRDGAPWLAALLHPGNCPREADVPQLLRTLAAGPAAVLRAGARSTAAGVAAHGYRLEPGDEQLIDAMAFNPVHGFPPLGITHARGAVYEASARNRGALGTDEARALLADGADRRAAARRN